MASPPPSARVVLAHRGHVPALAALVATSFRQFSLFSRLYAPLQEDISRAADTLWFWSRRLRLEMLDPLTELVVVEADLDAVPTATLSKSAVPEEDPSVRESREMSSWIVDVKNRGVDPQVRHSGRQATYVLGFAIWQARSPNKDVPRSVHRRQTWAEWLEALWIETELRFWNSIYQRKDQDVAAYREYLEAEEVLAAEYYAKETCYYLDNLTVDYRFQRQGLGRLLLDRGLESSHRLGLPAMTEAGERGEGLYLKAGFRKIGTWQVCGQELPVMRQQEE